MTSRLNIHHMTAFSDTPSGGNPAGVVITDQPLDEAVMREVAADVGYSETAFLVPLDGRGYQVRYFAPDAEVPFCGHATIAAGVLLGDQRGPGTFHLDTAAGPVSVALEVDDHGWSVATLTSVEPEVVTAADDLLGSALAHLGLTVADLDPRFRVAVASAGARHLILVLAQRERLARLDYRFDELRALMIDHHLTTVALLWRERTDRWHARNAFPVGGVVEDPATGAAAAAFGAYLRADCHLDPPGTFEIIQGEDLGRRSHIHVTVGTEGGIAVAGRAVPLQGRGLGCTS